MRLAAVFLIPLTPLTSIALCTDFVPLDLEETRIPQDSEQWSPSMSSLESE